MNTFRFRQSLRARLTAFTGILFLALALTLVGTFLFFVYTTERDTWHARQVEASENAAGAVADYLNKNEQILRWLDKYEFAEIQQNPEILQDILKDNPAFMELVFIDQHGNPLQGAAQNEPTLANQFTIVQSQWFRVARSGEKIYTRVQISPRNQSYTIFAMPSIHGGVWAAQIQMDPLWNTVAQIRFGETGSIYIVNESGQVIAHRNTQVVFSNQSIHNTPLFTEIVESQNRQWIGSTLNFEGVRVISASAPIEFTGWTVISELPVQEAYATTRRAVLLIPLEILLLIALTSWGFKEMLTRQIIEPLNLLNHGANQLGRGNLSHRIKIQRADEFGEVMAVFNSMAHELEAQQDKLTHDSLHDAMTGLPNRVLFLDRLGQAIEYCKRRPEYTFSVLFVDLDHFKIINDSLGHLTGDQLLILAGQRMKETLHSSDTVARLGGDEFAILLEITGEKESASWVAEKLEETIRLPFYVDGHELYVTTSIGIVMDIAGYRHAEEVLRDADIAMYQAKAHGKARFETFDIKMRSHAFSRLEMEEELRAALENGEFQVYYQPIQSMHSNELTSFEALIRWSHPTRGLLLPGEFLPVAEDSGLILPIEKWILHEACRQLRTWHQTYPALKHVSINVNVSNRQFSQPNFVEEIIRALQVNELEGKYLKLEITESVLISNYAAANEIFTQLQNLGIQLQIDDFGSGYSTLSYLQHFPISVVKIDKSFVQALGKGRRGTELIRAIVSMTRELGMETIAEGIETGDQFDKLRELSCTFGQGFLLSKPLDKATVEELLASQKTMVVS
jgi:diguanylate cyclase (GGDEF)-like protein